MRPSSVLAGGERKTSTSEARANWGIFVSSFVETTTVLESSGSIYMEAQNEISPLQNGQSFESVELRDEIAVVKF